MSTDFKFDFNSFGVAGWTAPSDLTTTGVKLSDIGGRGVNFELTAVGFNVGSSGALTSTDHHGIPEIVWDRFAAAPNYTDVPARFTGLQSGEEIEFLFFGVTGNEARPRKVVYNGTDYLHNEAGNPEIPDPPTVIPMTADASGNIDFIFSYQTMGCFYAGMILKFDLATELDTVQETVFNGESVPVTVIRSGGATISSVTLSDGTITENQTIASQSYDAGANETAAAITIAQSDLPFNGNYTLTVNLSDAQVLTASTELVVPANNQFDLVYDATGAVGSIYEGASSLPADGSQVQWTDYPNTIVQPNGMIFQSVAGAFDARVWDINTGTWGSWKTITGIEAVEPEPPGDSIGMTRRNITRRAFTRRAQTSRGMTS